MTALEATRNIPADKSACTAENWAKPDHIWVETAWAVLEAATDLGDNVTIEACQNVIVDDWGGDLPAQWDMNIIFCFLNAHAH